MALGLGQLHGVEASPDFPAGLEDYDSLQGAEMYDQSASGGVAQTGVSHMGGSGQGQGSAGQPANTMSHWSNLFDFKNGALPYLALATILYLGLISLHVSARAGR
jgi:hypothetical protein